MLCSLFFAEYIASLVLQMTRDHIPELCTPLLLTICFCPCTVGGNLLCFVGASMHHVSGPSLSLLEPFWALRGLWRRLLCVVLISQNDFNRKGEGLITQLVEAPAKLSMLLSYVTLLPLYILNSKILCTLTSRKICIGL